MVVLAFALRATCMQRRFRPLVARSAALRRPHTWDAGRPTRLWHRTPPPHRTSRLAGAWACQGRRPCVRRWRKRIDVFVHLRTGGLERVVELVRRRHDCRRRPTGPWRHEDRVLSREFLGDGSLGRSMLGRRRRNRRVCSKKRLSHGRARPGSLRGHCSGGWGCMVRSLPGESRRSRGRHSGRRVHRRLVRVDRELGPYGRGVVDLGRVHGGPHRWVLGLLAVPDRIWWKSGGDGVWGQVLRRVRRRVPVDRRWMHVVLLVLVRVGVLTLVLVRLIVASGHRGGRGRVLASGQVGLARVTSGVYHGRHMDLVLIWERVSALWPQRPFLTCSRVHHHGHGVPAAMVGRNSEMWRWCLLVLLP